MCAYECVVHAHTGAQVCACLCTCARVQVCMPCVHTCKRVCICECSVCVPCECVCVQGHAPCVDGYTCARACMHCAHMHVCECTVYCALCVRVCMFACVHTCLCMCLACAHGRLVRVCACVRAGVCGLGGSGWPAQARFPLWRRPPVATGKIAPPHAVRLAHLHGRPLVMVPRDERPWRTSHSAPERCRNFLGNA